MSLYVYSTSKTIHVKVPHIRINGLVQERYNSDVLAMELCLSCINPSIYAILEQF